MTAGEARMRVAVKRRLRRAGVAVRNDAPTAELATELRALRARERLSGHSVLGF